MKNLQLNSAIIEMADGFMEIIVENPQGDHPQITIQRNINNIVQDIATIKPTDYKTNVEVLVWEDPYDEEFTYGKVIGPYKLEEEI